MKKLFTVLAIALFTMSVAAQETNPTKQEPVKKETCCSKKEAKKCTAEAKTKCTAETKAKCTKTSKSCSSKKA